MPDFLNIDLSRKVEISFLKKTKFLNKLACLCYNIEFCEGRFEKELNWIKVKLFVSG